MEELIHTKEGELKFADPWLPLTEVGTKFIVKQSDPENVVPERLVGQVGEVTADHAYTNVRRREASLLPQRRDGRFYIMGYVDGQSWSLRANTLEVI